MPSTFLLLLPLETHPPRLTKSSSQVPLRAGITDEAYRSIFEPVSRLLIFMALESQASPTVLRRLFKTSWTSSDPALSSSSAAPTRLREISSARSICR